MAYPFQPMRTHTLKKLARLMKESWEKHDTDCPEKESVPLKIIPPETNCPLQDQILNHQ